MFWSTIRSLFFKAFIQIGWGLLNSFVLYRNYRYISKSQKRVDSLVVLKTEFKHLFEKKIINEPAKEPPKGKPKPNGPKKPNWRMKNLRDYKEELDSIHNRFFVFFQGSINIYAYLAICRFLEFFVGRSWVPMRWIEVFVAFHHVWLHSYYESGSIGKLVPIVIRRERIQLAVQFLVTYCWSFGCSLVIPIIF